MKKIHDQLRLLRSTIKTSATATVQTVVEHWLWFCTLHAVVAFIPGRVERPQHD